MAESKITITDFRLSGYCVKGVKREFESRGLDFRAFLRDGMEIETLREAAKTDGLAKAVLDKTMKRRADDGR